MAHLRATIDPVDNYTANLIMTAAGRVVNDAATSSVMTQPERPDVRVLDVRWTAHHGGALEAVQRIQGDLTRRGLRIHSLTLDGQARNPRDIWAPLVDPEDY